MPKRKRHSSAEITAKLDEANLLISQGKRQQDVALALSISVMTFHRWRKAQLPQDDETHVPTLQASSHGRERGRHLAELQLENSRLRRLVTDLLLEKIKLEELSPQQDSQVDSINQASH